MASNRVPDDWQVRILSVSTSITKKQLSAQLEIDVSRISIPKVQNKQQTKYSYVQIDGFYDEDDAQAFVARNSQLKCSVHRRELMTIPPDRRSRSGSSLSTRSSSTNTINRIDSLSLQTNAIQNSKTELRSSAIIIDLSTSQHDFLVMFGNQHLDKILWEEGIDDVRIKDSRIQLVGYELAIKNVTTYLRSKLYERAPQIAQAFAEHLEWGSKKQLLKEFQAKYRVGISYYMLPIHGMCEQREGSGKRKMNDDINLNQSEDSDDNSSIASSHHTILSNTSSYRTDNPRKRIQVTLCSDSEDILTKAIKELEHERLYHDSWMLAEKEVEFMSQQASANRPGQKRRTPIQEQSFQMKQCLLDVIRRDSNLKAQIFVNHKKNGWQLKVSGLKKHVEAVVSKLKIWLDQNIQSEEQLAISKVMAVFLRTKALSDLKKLENEQSIRINIHPPRPSHQNPNDKKDDDNDEDHCIKIIGSKLYLRTYLKHVKNLLDTLFEEEKNYSCPSWDSSKEIGQFIRSRLRKICNSDDCQAIGWIKNYTQLEKRETSPQVTVAVVGFKKEAVQDVHSKCEDIVQGYIIWKPAVDDFNRIFRALIVKKSPSLEEFQQTYEAKVWLDRETSTIVLLAGSKICAANLQDTLLSLEETDKQRIGCIYESIFITQDIHRFVKQAMRAVTEEAKFQKVEIDLKTRNRILFYGPSDPVNIFKAKVNSFIDHIRKKLIKRPLQLSSVESDLIRSNRYKILQDIEHKTNTTIRDVKADDEMSLPMITVANSRNQTIAVMKSDITKLEHVNAIVEVVSIKINDERERIMINHTSLPLVAGEVVKTTADDLRVKDVIYAISPQYIDGHRNECSLLYSCIMKSLQLAEREGYHNIALSFGSSTRYGFSLNDCTNIIVRSIKQFFANHPQSKLRYIILIDMNDVVYNAFAREITIDHDDGHSMIPIHLPSLKAKWCCEDDRDIQPYTDSDMHRIDDAFENYLKDSQLVPIKIQSHDPESGAIVIYYIHFLPDLKERLSPNLTELEDELVCGYQISENTNIKRKLIRYPVERKEENRVEMVQDCSHPLDLYQEQIVNAKEYWHINGLTDEAVDRAETLIRTAIQEATFTESFSIPLDDDTDANQAELISIAQQHSIEVGKVDELCIPKEWSDQTEICKLVEISTNDPNFIRIENRMKETLSNVKIHRIERVQNTRIWNHYTCRRRELGNQLKHLPESQIEKELFHGTRRISPEEIYNGEYGFALTFRTSGMWGFGTYFTESASYSCDQYAYSLLDGKRQIFLAHVLTGEVYHCLSDPSLRRPPRKNDNVSGLRYNSISGETQGSQVYIIYDNCDAYPTYLITFTP